PRAFRRDSRRRGHGAAARGARPSQGARARGSSPARTRVLALRAARASGSSGRGRYLDAMKLIVHVDGGARGNPGPAAAACVVSSPEGEVLSERSQLLGTATNNVAEYRALLLGLQCASELGASEVDVVGDSELIAKQVRGVYKVRHEAMRPLY